MCIDFMSKKLVNCFEIALYCINAQLEKQNSHSQLNRDCRVAGRLLSK